ncbi:hypothetical protein [Halobacteriovorax sp. HLS]|uniref:hypothetical protein n=1 Tax=Halobacteriovorax sp. HLS TaxID=2234000 RepID=UPI000FDB12ED|nr:hypothetical protein [Halobacteriovorax sp. HLS]
MKLFSKTICSSMLIGVLSLNTYANLEEIPRVKVLDKMMTTINPTAELDGPLFRNTEVAKLQYGSEFAKTLIQEAHKRAKFLLEEGNTQAYYGFLTLALTVPLHEGLYMHVREVNDQPGLCNQHANSGNILFAYTQEKLDAKYTAEELAEAKLKGPTFKNFTQYFKTPGNSFFPDCDSLKDDQVIRQIIRGGDGSDLGAMQLSIRWHYDIFLAQEQYKSLRKTMSYGLNFLMSGYKKVLYNWRSSKKVRLYANGRTSKKKWKTWMSCLRSRNDRTQIDYEKLIRGTWAGKYNSGNLGQTCRFADTNGPYASHDTGFKRNLDKVLDFPNQEKIGVFDSISFSMNPEVKAAYDEIVTNFKEQKNSRISIEKILE